MVIVVIAGLVGGAISSRFFMGKIAFAKNIPRYEKIIAAEEYHIIGKGGKSRAALALTNYGEPALIFWDENEKACISIGFLADGSFGLSLSDKRGDPRIVISLDVEGNQLLGFSDKNGMNRAILGLEPDGSPILTLFDKDGKKPLWQVP